MADSRVLAVKARVQLIPDRALMDPAARRSGLVEVTLVPKKPRALKSAALVVLPSTGEVKRLFLVDASGNRTTFSFTQTTPGRKRPDSDFTLAPPEGTKILTE